MTAVSRILSQLREGESRAAEELLPLVYDQLRKLAQARLANEQPGQTLQATALVHEAYVRLLGDAESEHNGWDSRAHFFAAAAEAMRRILIESARRKLSKKRGVDFTRIQLSAVELSSPDRSGRLVALDDALNKLEERDPQKAKLVKLRFFAGLTNREAASALGISSSTADRYWTYARAWLQTEMQSS